MIDNRWYHSSTVYADYDGDENRTLGQISGRKASATANIEFQFAGCGQLELIEPTPRFFNWSNATVDRWHSTGWFTHTAIGACAERSDRDLTDFLWMNPVDGGEPYTPGTDGGLMSEQDSATDTTAVP